MSSNVLISASAGTGKTQRLAERLIALLKEGVEPREIVALTFSRAAAGEIFERFVTLLAERGEAELLRKVIATQHLSQIGTLDSFLMRIVRAFPLELGLHGELEMLDEYEERRERERLSFSILRRTDARLKRSFVSAFAFAMNHEDVRSFVDAYRDFIDVWHEKVAAMPQPSAWGDPTPIWGGPRAFAAVTERELAAAADKVMGLEPAKQWMKFAEWVRNFRGRITSADGFAKKLLGSDGVFKGTTVEITFYRKTYSYDGEAAEAIRDAIRCVFGYVVRMKLELAKGIYALVSAFEREYDAKVRRRGRLVFADIPRLLSELDASERLALEYRMDARLRAWALDEFQDTSREQWRAIGNLVDEALQDEEKSVFVVGDDKQAIYGWRNGDVSIFRREKSGGMYDSEELTKTYRSRPAVVEAVNRVFARGRLREDFPGWTCPEHEAARAQPMGFVQTVEAGGRSMKDFVEPVANALKAADPVRRGKTAAVLVRHNAFGRLLCDELKRLGVGDVVWEGEKPVLGTVALTGFLDLVQLAEHPGDQLAYRHLLKTPLAALVGAEDALSLSRRLARAFAERGLVRVFRELRAKLPSDPEAAWSRYTEDCYTDMLKAAEEFELGMKAGTRLSDFPRYLSSRGKRERAEDGKIRIMTIHHSKGLGFDYVVLPLYEYGLLTKEPDTPLVGDGWILPDPGATVARAVGGLDSAYADRKLRAEQESLCTYYVAMTRAKEAMTIILHPAPGKEDAWSRMSNYVRAGIGGNAEIGDRAWFDLRSPAPPLSPSPFALPQPSLPRGPRVKVRRRLPSLNLAEGQRAGALFAAQDSRRAALSRGTELHAEYERVEWVEPAAAKDDFDRALVRPDGFVDLWRERAFEVFAEGEWVSGRFDRVVFCRDAAGLRAEIQDFKTNRPGRGESAADFATRMRTAYAGQLGAYRRALAALANLAPERITTSLLAVATRERIVIDG